MMLAWRYDCELDRPAPHLSPTHGLLGCRQELEKGIQAEASGWSNLSPGASRSSNGGDTVAPSADAHCVLAVPFGPSPRPLLLGRSQCPW